LKKDRRYDVSDLTEAQFEPGSNDLVLKNRLGIMSPQEMDVAEARALERAMNSFIGSYGESNRFMVDDLFALHKDWLSEIYDWAGPYRQVNISKDGFPFAAAAQVPRLMALFERDVLQRNTPCTFKDQAEVIRTLAETHVELVLIHPFREGNGRLARILSTLMALQAGLPLLDFSLITGVKKEAYFAAIQAGMDKNYQPMEKLFAGIIEKSVASS
jgi:cell filamentation protein